MTPIYTIVQSFWYQQLTSSQEKTY